MKIISLETSGREASLATLQHEDQSLRTVREIVLPGNRRTAKDLAPAMSRLLAESGWRPHAIQLVATSIGPGSFTGLRIGVTAAKTFAYAVGADLLGISTLRTIAQQVAADTEAGSTLHTVIAAERGQVFAAQYLVNPHGQVDRTGDIRVVDAQTWIGSLIQGDRVAGPALNQLAHALPEKVQMAASSLWRPTATMTGRLASADHHGGRREDVWGLVPQYYRLSAAEETLRNKRQS